MNPVKCPNCRLSLPQNWTGASDPNAKCPYCGKPLSGPSTSTVASPSPAVASPAPRPAGGAKTILWGAGMGIAIPTIPKTVPQPQSTPSSATLPPAENPLGTAATQHRDAISETDSSRSSEPEPANSATNGGGFDANVDAPAPQPAPRPIQQSSATVMFEPAAPATNLPGQVDRVERAEFEPPAPAYQPSAFNEAADRDGASSDASDDDYEETSPRTGTGSRATPTRSKYKSSKKPPKKGMKSKSGQRWSSAKDEDDSGSTEQVPTSSRKAPIIVVATLGLIAMVGAGVYFLRGHTPSEPAPAATPAVEPAAPAAKPVAQEEFVPPTPVAPVGKEKPAEKPAHAEKADKPVHAEKADKPEKAEPLHSEGKPAAGKPTEEEFRRANEAYERGNTKLFQGHTAEAINEFNLALKLNPKDPTSHRGLGLAYAQSGKSAEALKHLKAYLKESPKASDRAVIEKRIDQLRGQ